jgi:FkbM family methyltransferase
MNHLMDIKDWHRDRGDETLKFDFPLDARSVVLDIGAYQGLWSEAISKRYGCRIHAYEPVKKFYVDAVERLKNHRNVEVHNHGLWTETGTMGVGVNGVSSGLFVEAQREACWFQDIIDIMDGVGLVNLIGMNCEGAEYSLLDKLIARGYIRNIGFLLVQFHAVKDVDVDARYNKIRDALMETHKLKWRYPSIWECWERRIGSFSSGPPFFSG